MKPLSTRFVNLCLIPLLFFVAVLPSRAQDYLIGSEDVLKISVFEYPDLATQVRVSGNGSISFPLLGEIRAKDLTTVQLEGAIASKLSAARIVKEPQVSVYIDQYHGRKVTVIGEVVKPGQYEFSGRMTLLDAISLVLGMTQNAGYRITVFRKDPTPDGREATTKIGVDVDRLLNGADLSQDVELKNCDVIYVPKAVFYIYGEVNHPGAYRLEKGITVKRAIALAGGLTPKGTERRIEVTRRDGEKDSIETSQVDDPVRIDDVIRIRESIF